MYITCEQCSTIFRLDEKRLKPTGSKVRCSQCSKIFVAWPMASTRMGTAEPISAGSALENLTQQPPADTFDQELDGIDLAELDSILERDRKVDSDLGDSQGDQAGDAGLEEARELDEADLDLDFESALALDEEPAADMPAAGSETDSEALDLDMDFELEAEGPLDNQDATAEDQQLEDELDMDFELDGDVDLQAASGQQEQEVPAGDSIGEDEIELALDDFEDVLSTPEETKNNIVQPEEVAADDLDLDLDLDLDEEPARTEAEAEDEELELSLDEGDVTEPEPEEGPEAAEAPAAGEEEEFDLTDLGGLIDEDEVQAESPVDDEQIELSLDEEELSGKEEEPLLDMEMEDAAAPEAGAPEPSEEDIDLSGFDDLLAEDELTEKPEPEDQELSLDDGEALSLDEEIDFETEQTSDSGVTAAAGDIQDDDIDLSGFDELLDEADEPVDEAESGDLDLSLDDETEPEDLELSLDDEIEPDDLELSLDDESNEEPSDEPVLEMATDEKADEDLGGLEDLEFELDAEFEDKPTAKKDSEDQAVEEPEAADEEIDLSDIEKMLEDDSLASTPGSTTDDLDLDLAGGSEKWVDDTSHDLEKAGSGELDLTEIEAAIDGADESVDERGDDDQELELDLEAFGDEQQEQDDEFDLQLEMEEEPSAAGNQTVGDDTEELDLSDIDLSAEVEKPENEVINAGDIELEFQIEDDQPAVIDSAETLTTESRTTATPFGDTPTVPEEEEDKDLIDEAFSAESKAEKMAAVPKPVPQKKKGAGKSLIVILILALLGGGGYYGYDYIIKNNITIPFLSDYINPKLKDPNGIAMLSTLEINSKFIENQKAGRIFVVTGKVRNGYSTPRKMIQLQGKLFAKGKVLAKTEQSYAGVIVSDAELASQDINQIKQRLRAPAGQAGGLVVNSGQTIPFMVVFSELPADLDEFAIEMIRSVKVQ